MLVLNIAMLQSEISKATKIFLCMQRIAIVFNQILKKLSNST